jgi:hypothetical protein
VRFVVQFLVAGLGGLVFHLLGIPAAWLSGAIVAVVLWSFTGQARPMPPPLVDAAMLLSGVLMGASVTPETLAAVSRYPSSLVLLLLGLIAISAASALWLVKVSGWRRDDAVLASVPGSLTMVLAIAAERNAAVVPITIVQSFRFLILVTLLPSGVVLLGGGDASMLIGEGQPVTSPAGLGLALLGGWLVGLGFRRLGVAAPLLFGGALVTTLLHLTGWAPGVVPPVIATAGLVLIGTFLGDRFQNFDWRTAPALLPAAVGSFAVGITAAGLFAALAAAVSGVGLGEALVAFAPGGLEAMMVLALILGLDPLYVGTHHLVRMVALGVGVPLLVTWLDRGRVPEPG